MSKTIFGAVIRRRRKNYFLIYLNLPPRITRYVKKVRRVSAIKFNLTSIFLFAIFNIELHRPPAKNINDFIFPQFGDRENKINHPTNINVKIF